MVALRNTTDVQMFLFGKQTKQTVFFRAEGLSKQELGPLWTPHIHRRGYDVFYLTWFTCCTEFGFGCGVVCFYVCTCYVRRIPLIVLECRGGALWIMNWRKTCSEHSPVLPASPMIYTLAFSRSILAPRGLAGPQVKTWVRQKWNERRAKHKEKRLVWFLFACCAPNVCLTVS